MPTPGDTPFDLTAVSLGVGRDGRVTLLPNAWGAPPKVDGHHVAFVQMTRAPPHGGERHDDGDEPILLLSGAVDILLDEGGPNERTVALRAGHGFVVPRGVWHRLIPHEPCTFVVITPGPSQAHRPRRA
jgi:mannose-6-phosphate isomerase-like protein (cupin superfamily)